MGKIKQFFRDLSLRKTIAVYITVMALAAIGMSAFTSYICRSVSDAIYNTYPPSGERYYLTTEDGKRLGLGGNISVGMDKSTISSGDERLLMLLDILPVICYPLYSALCVGAAALLFYRRKLKLPLSLLAEGSRKISENNLDFSICFQSKDEMGQLCASFETMRAALSCNFSELFRQMEERRRLNAAFAHDLRTPLTVLKGYTEMLMEEGDTSAGKTAAVMSRHLLRLECYAESMSSIHRLEDRKPKYQSVCPVRLAADLERSAALLCSRQDKQLLFETDLDSAPLLLDPEIIHQIFDNLLSNAVRYAESKISVLICESGGGLILSVSDDGPGFSDRGLHCASEPYYTEASGNSNFGLGLYVCKILCRHHGGKLLLENTASGALVRALIKSGK